MTRSFVRRVRWVALAAMLAMGLMAMPAWAWNDCGHMVVARIAWLKLSEEQRKTVSNILKHHPHYDSYLVDKCPEDVSPEEWAFLRAATWADHIRPPKGKTPNELAEHPRYKFHRGPWHYVNYPYVAGQKSSALPKQPLPNDTHILMQVNHSLDVLHHRMAQDAGAVSGISPEANQAVRMTWLFHLIGDLHQPLHTVALVNEKLFPDGDHGDQGGNLLAIRPSETSKPMRLHAYWDGMLGFDSRFPNVSRLADELTHDPNLVSEKLPELQHKQVQDWAAESYLHAKSNVYRDGQFPQIRMSDVEDGKVAADDVPAVQERDSAKSLTLARRRVTLGGLRLAETLARLTK